jgi:hypothetical protein
VVNPSATAESGHRSETFITIRARFSRESRNAVIPRNNGGLSTTRTSTRRSFTSPTMNEETTNDR